jgi:SAM-dependent methyltransferase
MDFLKNQSIYMKILLFLATLLVVFALTKPLSTLQQEGFRQKERYVIRKNGKIYDDFYVSLFDMLFQKDELVREELDLLSPIVEFNQDSHVLDVAAGSGMTLELLKKRNIPAIGIDESKAYVDLAKNKFSDIQIALGSPLKSNTFHPSSFSHILSLYFTLYYIKDKTIFFKNCYDWLMPGGYLVIHLVNRDKFDPIVPSGNPFLMVSPQKYAKQRITKSKVKLTNFQYDSDFTLNKEKNTGTFTETFTNDNDGHVRQNVHTLYMDTQRHILSLAKDVGFSLLGKLDLNIIQYEYNYLYILQK